MTPPELARALFEARAYPAALEVLRAERRLRGPEPKLLLLELVCRSAIGQGEAADILSELERGPSAPAELKACRPWLPGGPETMETQRSMAEHATRLLPRKKKTP